MRSLRAGAVGRRPVPLGNKTKCNANAKFMFEMPDLERSRLITHTTEAGVETWIERVKYQTEEVFTSEVDLSDPAEVNRA